MVRLRGQFHPATRRPFVDATVAVPRLRRVIDTVLLVDTGADTSLLSAADASALGLDGGVGASAIVGGVTGRLSFPRELVTFAFRAGGRMHLYRLRVLIPPSDSELSGLPSLLGRDVLNRWHMAYRPTQDKLTFDIVTSDGEIPIK